MKQFFKSIIFSAVVAVSIVACSDADVDEPTPEYTSGTTLIAVTPTASETKVSFEDNDSEGIALSWEEGDTFTIYETNGTRIGDFKCVDADNGTFANTDITLEDGEYTAVYPASDIMKLSDINNTVPSEQDGDAINNLDAACMMEAEFSYSSSSENTSIVFAHTKAVMTFSFASENRPSKLIFENGSDQYTVTYTDIEAVNGIYTSHIMIEPCEKTEESRTLVFTLYNSNGIAYDRRTATTTKAYIAGYRYTAPISTTLTLKEEDENEALVVDIAFRDDVYEIYTAKGLQAFACLVDGSSDPGANWKDYTENTKSVDSNNTNFNFSTANTSIDGVLMNDIDLSEVCGATLGSWDPIGSAANKYAGIFDGDGYEVKELYINTNFSQQALFAYTTIDGVVCNIGVDGSVTASLPDTTTINADGIEVKQHNYETAGIVAFNYGTVVNSYNLATISGEINVGGVVGHNDGYIINCYNHGTIKGTGLSSFDEGKNIGGVCGQCDDESDDDTLTGYGYILACYSAGEVTTESTAVNPAVGLVLGWLNADDRGLVSECYCVGDDATDNLIGWMKAIVETNEDGTTTIIEAGSALSSSTYPMYTLTEDEMKGNETVVTDLNSKAAKCNGDGYLKVDACKWKVVSGEYPELDFDTIAGQ